MAGLPLEINSWLMPIKYGMEFVLQLQADSLAHKLPMSQIAPLSVNSLPYLGCLPAFRNST